MSQAWRERAYTVDEAAKLAGIRRATLDVWITRLEGADTLFSVKRGGRRWFSVQDISILAVARSLADGGVQLLIAVAAAYEHLQSAPDPDAILVVPAGTGTATSGRIISDRDVPRLQIETSTLLIPVGKIVAEIEAACAELYKRAA